MEQCLSKDLAIIMIFILIQAVSVEEMNGATGLGMTSVNPALSAGQVNHNLHFKYLDNTEKQLN